MLREIFSDLTRVGNCVGAGNYKWFNLFLWFVIMGAMYIVIVCATDFALLSSRASGNWVEKIIQFPFHIGLICYCLIASLSVLSLCIYHCDLICTGKTTYEKVC